MAIFLALPVSCSKDTVRIEGNLKITGVELSGFEPALSTKSSYTDEYSTVFEEGDRLGLILTDAQGKQIENAPYTYTAGRWENPDVMYSSEISGAVAYFPYNDALARDVTTVDALKAAVEIRTDQSSAEDFAGMDLLVCEIPEVSENIGITFRHAFSLLTLSAEASVTAGGETFGFNIGMEDVTLSIGDEVYIPYSTGGANMWIVRDGTGLEPEIFRYTYTVSGGERQTKTVTAPVITLQGTNYPLPFVFSPDSGQGLSEGDFYCVSDAGNVVVIPAYAAALPDGLDCKGVVFHVMDGSAFGDFARTNGMTAGDYPGYEGEHGLMLSVTAGLNFGMANDDGQVVMNALTDYLNTNDVPNGFAITRILKERASDSGSGITFNALDNHSEKASSGTTDWYAPSFHELKYLIRGTEPETVTDEGRLFINGQLGKVCDMQLAGSIPSVSYIEGGTGTGFCLMQENGTENGWHGIPGSEVYYPICAF